VSSSGDSDRVSKNPVLVGKVGKYAKTNNPRVGKVKKFRFSNASNEEFNKLMISNEVESQSSAPGISPK